MSQKNSYEPEWARFAKLREGDTQQKEFFEKVYELHKKGVLCKCGNKEATPEGCCTLCYLFIADKEIEWIWSYPRDGYSRWLCYPPDFYRKMIKHKSANGNSGAFIMAINSGNLWELMRWFIFDKQLNQCNSCKEVLDIDKCELHHILAKTNGGREEEENLEMLCKLCHRKKMIEIYED